MQPNWIAGISIGAAAVIARKSSEFKGGLITGILDVSDVGRALALARLWFPYWRRCAQMP
jgi:hypothetical protein